MRRTLTIFLYFVYGIIGLSLLTLVLSWILFSQYSDFYISTHQASFVDLPDDQFRKNTVIFILALRGLFALGWISSLLYTRKLVQAHNRHLLAIVTVYAVISFLGYGLLACQPALPWQTIIRCLQSAIGASMIVLICVPNCRSSIRDYIGEYESVSG
ncbi:hypothetical protein GMA10_08865 [Kocuria koreensis]|uniref:Uncharacterized protein n=1 Tax=Rothia koreensis TaxID=592378 RepID=A0A7K1LJE6_9MICC|nr:hypothetical protein [Rothia koreensis]MUN55316.1 hypothetical protein [Rothia koreensis]